MSWKCNLPAEDRERIFAGFDDNLNEQEQERIEALFRPHLFYQTVKRNQRECFCEACHRSFTAIRTRCPVFFREKHGSPIECPMCRAKVELICNGRIQTGASLEESTCVMVIRTDADGALRIMAGVATRKYHREDYFDDWNNILYRELQPTLEFGQTKRYYLAPWGRMCWKHGWWNYFGERGPYGDWEEKNSIVQAFTPGYMGYWNNSIFDGQSYVIGAENIERSYAKYSAAILWLAGREELEDNERVFGLEQYLAAYAEYPQLEFAAKMGEEDAIRDLVLRGIKNHRIINWRATNPADFYRMDKQQYKRYVAAGGSTKDLLMAKELKVTVDDVLTAKAAVGSSLVHQLLSCAKSAGVSITQAAGYVGKKGRTVTIWSDYLDMARKLGYDLNDRGISTPSRLLEAHDRAAEILQAENDRTINQKYKKRRYSALRKKYEMEYAGMCVRVPRDTVEIATEGKVLCHCVGGYAKRHVQGNTTILFLRMAYDPERPLVTIEMMPDGKTIKQIHGWHNECVKVNGVIPPSPRETFSEFLDVWLEWLAEGSQKTSTGKPIIMVKTNQEVLSA